MAIIDFYHVDSFEIFEYLSIVKNLDDLGCEINLVLPDYYSDWFDKSVAEKVYDELCMQYSHRPSMNADMVITTQYHSVINIPEYNDAVSCRLVYGINSEKNFTYSCKSSIPFDVVVCPGEYSFNLLKRYTHPLIGGYPKYDSYFLGEFQRNKLLEKYGLPDDGRKNILYLPTWSTESSLGNCDQFLVELSSNFNVIIKPHHVSLRKEISRWRDLSHHSDLYIISKVSPLSELLNVSDFVISDALSGSFWESILIGQKPTLGLMYGKKHRLKNMEKKVDDYAVISRDPSSMGSDFYRSIDYFNENQAHILEERENFISYTDGSAGKKTAEGLLRFIEMYNKSKRLQIEHTVRKKLFGYLSANAISSLGSAGVKYFRGRHF